MTFQKWRDVAELIALVAVVGSLIAVVTELRQTQAALQAQTYQDRAFDAIEWHMEIAKDPRLTISGLVLDSFDPANLTPAEHEIAKSIVRTILIDADNEHYQYQRGFLDEDFYHGDTVDTIERFGPVWRKSGIRESRHDFRVEVDRILSEYLEQ